MKNLANQLPNIGVKIWENDKIIGFSGLGPEAAVEVRSADNPSALVGEGLDQLVTDETALFDSQAWFESLRPTLSDKLGSALLVGTPKGRGWFFDEWCRGRDGSNPDYMSWQFESRDNPYFPSGEWEAAKLQLPEDVFKQEYRAQFLEDSAGVFRGILSCRQEHRCGHGGPWVIGVDIAKQRDFTVMSRMCKKCGDVHEIDRWNKIDWPVQSARIAAFAKKWRGRVILDATGIGDPIYDDLKRMGVNLEGVKLSLQTKTAIIRRLQQDLENGDVSWPVPRKRDTWEIMEAELQRYEYKMTPRGAVLFSAPPGYHDDCVISLGLANWGKRMSRGWMI